MDGSDSTPTTKVRISTEVRPLPLLDIGMTLTGACNANGNLVIEVERTEKGKPEWVLESEWGSNPSGWVGKLDSV